MDFDCVVTGPGIAFWITFGGEGEGLLGWWWWFGDRGDGGVDLMG